MVARDRRRAVGRDRCKIAADKNPAVRLDDDDANHAIRIRIEAIERGLPADSRRAVRQQYGKGKQLHDSFPCGSRCCSQECEATIFLKFGRFNSRQCCSFSGRKQPLQI